MFKNISPKKLHSDAVKAYQEKNFRLASELFGQIANLVPSDPEAKYNHGVALQSAGLFGDAVKAFLLTIKLQPLNAAAHNNLGNAYKSLKRPDDAEAAYKKAIKIDATKPEAVNNLGLLMQNRGNFSEAEVLFRECLNIIPNEPSVLTNLGNVLRDRGRFVEAISVYNEVLTKNKNNVLILKNLAIALLNNGQNDEALSLYNRILEINPEKADSYINLAKQSLSMGDKPHVEQLAKKALELEPANEEAYYLLMMVKKVRDTNDKYLLQLKKLLQDNLLSDEQRMKLNFAASFAHQGLKEYKTAFYHLKLGNDIKNNFSPFVLYKTKKRFELIKKIFDVNLMRRMNGVGIASHKPLFIVGMPRSGTSLVEQILSSHSSVHGAGELKNLNYQVEQILNAGEKFPEGVRDWKRSEFTSLAKAYLEDISSKGGNAKRVSDKQPSNFIFIGLIRLALPGAKIIHCIRNPIDTCFSCYKQNFTTGQNFSNNLKDLGNYYRLYQDLMHHWRLLFKEEIYDLSYEKIVEDPKTEIRKLLSFCDLDWEDGCLEFHANKRQVHTASAMQVRNPIYRSSVESWRHYEVELAPLFSALKLK